MGKRLNFSPTPLLGAYLITPNVISDDRGEFFRTFCTTEFEEAGINFSIKQMNHSINAKRGTLRGMHFQMPKSPESKIVRCTNGSVFDVIIDIRSNSDTFKKYYSVELNAVDKNMLYIPAGCAHGFITLENNSEILYCHSSIYSPEHESGLRYDDPLFNINWPIDVSEISERDSTHPYLDSNFKGFKYEL
jgi:dTDP-4-dehydrorhamnose 3,5-epimerase